MYRFNFGALQMQQRQLHRGFLVCWGWMPLDQFPFRKQSPFHAIAGAGRGVSFSLAWDITILVEERAKYQIWSWVHLCFSSVTLCIPGMCCIDLIWFSFSSSKAPLCYSFLDRHCASVSSRTQVVLHLELRLFLCKRLICLRKTWSSTLRKQM